MMKNEKKFYIMQQAFGQKELHEREAECTRNDPPQCSARCPINLDARALCAAVAEGDFKKGTAVLRQATPFIRLISAACEAPCESACVLTAAGGGVAISALEKSCVRFGEGDKPRLLLPRKNARVAVIGNDLFALAAAAELGLRGYETDFYSLAPEPGDLLKPYLNDESSAADCEIFASLKVKLIPDIPADIPACSANYGALCVSRPEGSEKGGRPMPQGVFMPEEGLGVVETLCAAKSAALSADRYIQKVATEEGRKREGAFESNLFVNEDEISAAASPVIVDKTPITQETAKREAARCIQCSCAECMRGCAFLQHYKTNPRQLIREVYNNLSIVMGDHGANTMINSCALCGQCSVTCPNGFDVKGVCYIARRTMVDTGKMPPSTHDFALLDMAFSNSNGFLARPPADGGRCDYVFFPGCQAAAISPQTVIQTYGDLCKRVGHTGILLGCCGAVADWAGQQILFGQTLDLLVSAWEELGRPTMITACPTCQKLFAEFTSIPTRSIYDLLSDIGVPDTAKRPQNRSVMIHDACGARGNALEQAAVRTVISAAGYPYAESAYAKDSAVCCGYGGLQGYANRAVSQKMTESCLAQLGDRICVTYCMACRDRFAKAGSESRHVLELVYGQDDTAAPDLSARRYNRIQLKKRLLEELFSETMEQKNDDFILDISPEVAAIMDERMILRDDLYRVFEEMRETNSSVLDRKDGLLTTCARIGNVTFWVRFSELPDGYRVNGVYSHRMTVEVL